MPDRAKPVFLTGGTGVLGRPALADSGGIPGESPEPVASKRSVDPKARGRSGGSEAQRTLRFAKSRSLHLATHIPPTSQMRRPNVWAQNDFLRREVTRAPVQAAAEDVRAFIHPSVCRVYPDSGDRWIDAESSSTQGAVLAQSTLEAERVIGFGQTGRAERGP
jgi:hypothetical protein